MDIKIADISDKYDAITQLIDKSGFCNGFLSKSVISEKKKEFILVVSEKDSKIRGELFELTEALRLILQCEVVVMRDTGVLPFIWQFWDDTNRVHLHANPSEQDKKSFSASLEKIFGEKWVFVPLREPERYQKIDEKSTSFVSAENNGRTHP